MTRREEEAPASAAEVDPLLEHKAALAKIDGAVAVLSSKAGDALACDRGCASCCADGLSVLPVEAALIEASGLGPPEAYAPGERPRAWQGAPACVFLDVDDGACSIYPVRPVLCRTHGLALRTGGGSATSAEARGGLRIVDGGDVSHCALNYTARAPAPEEILDAEKVLALLVTVDRRYRKRAGIPDDVSRVSLREVAYRIAKRRAATTSG